MSERRVAQPDSAAAHGPGLPGVAWGVYAAGALVGGLAVMTVPAVALLPALFAVLILALVDLPIAYTALTTF